MLDTRDKRPGDRLDYDIDASRCIASGDAITDVAVAVAGQELVIESSQFTDTSMKVWLSGGVLGKTYEVVVTFATRAGRVKECSFKMRIRNN